MNKICTSLEQSKKLIELGIDVSTADMFWKNGVSNKYIQCFTPFVSNGTNIDFDYDIPAWSLSALLSVLPDEITDDGDVYRNMVFHLKGKYIIQYPRLTTLWPSLLSVEEVNLIDACVEMIIKLYERKML